MASSGMLYSVALVRTDVTKELNPSFIRVTRIGELGTLAVNSNRRTLRRNAKYWHPDEGGAKVPPNLRFLQEPHGVRTQKTPFFIVTAVKTSILTG
jgi:hypothetical protein